MTAQPLPPPSVSPRTPQRSTGDCVEVAHTADGGRAVRDSKVPARGTQHFSAGAWRTFTAELTWRP
ncbi:DUF397 domain-containing protein [Streptomyces iconiensis]|uniref:DUF397 domain-containing protein n=1 Tax=Streptomyces iconiensis TaxID=1384038 RepID=UPI003D2F90BB